MLSPGKIIILGFAISFLLIFQFFVSFNESDMKLFDEHEMKAAIKKLENRIDPLDPALIHYIRKHHLNPPSKV